MRKTTGRESITPAKRRFREALLGGESKSSISEVKQIGVYKDFCCLQGIELEGNLNVVTTPAGTGWEAVITGTLTATPWWDCFFPPCEGRWDVRKTGMWDPNVHWGWEITGGFMNVNCAESVGFYTQPSHQQMTTPWDLPGDAGPSMQDSPDADGTLGIKLVTARACPAIRDAANQTMKSCCCTNPANDGGYGDPVKIDILEVVSTNDVHPTNQAMLNWGWFSPIQYINFPATPPLPGSLHGVGSPAVQYVLGGGALQNPSEALWVAIVDTLFNKYGANGTDAIPMKECTSTKRVTAGTANSCCR